MDACEFYRVLAPVIAAIKCGHTSVDLPKPLQNEMRTTRLLLPLYVRVTDGKAYVVHDLAPTNGALAGLELRVINGVLVSRIVETLIAAAPADGDVRTSREYRISGLRFGIGLAQMFGMTSPYHLSLWDAATRRELRVKLDGERLPRLSELLTEKYPRDGDIQRNAELEFLDNGAIAHMTIRGFYGYADDEKSISVGQFINVSFEAIRVRGSKALVLDLRRNGGGEDELGRLLLSYLVETPFDYYDDLVINHRHFDFDEYLDEKVDIPDDFVEKRSDDRYHAVGHPNWGRQQPSAPGFSGKVVILIDGGSFSTTSEFLSHVADRHRATFVGEESGGAYFGNTSGFGATVVLPHSGMQVRIPLMTYYLAVRGPHDVARGIIPDVPVQPEIRDLVDGRDRAMETALDIARGRNARRPTESHKETNR
jgi:hypothetical protein